MKKIDLSGQRFGRLVVLEETDPYYPSTYSASGKRVRRWLCECDCGTRVKVIQASLKSGNTKSCGCGCKENREKILNKPNVKRCKYPDEKRLKRILVTMKQRCYNPKYKYYKNYGGRGIDICEDWMSHNGSDNFCEWALSHGYKEDLTIDRIDNNKGYSPDNCRWIDRFEQMSNTRKNRLLTYNGKTQCLAKWAREYNLKYATLIQRLELGWELERALNEPTNIKYRRRTT